ncbi:MAG: hypothetical protein J1E42_02440 [Akkermansiaceae bacterium]|nr:hypothetical protein [Akkermansiaceae bacterium]
MAFFSIDEARYPGRVRIRTLIWMAIFVILTAGIGVCYVCLKHEQVAMRTELEKKRLRIRQCKNNIAEYNSKTDALTNSWSMRGRLSQAGSELRDILPGQIETAQSYDHTTTIRTTASR